MKKNLVKTISEKKLISEYFTKEATTSLLIGTGTMVRHSSYVHMCTSKEELMLNMFLASKNCFLINRNISESGYMTEEEIFEVVSLFENYFPVEKGNKKFGTFLEATQYYINNSVVGMSDYSIFEINNYIVVFHIDLNNGLGPTVSSIFRKEDIAQYMIKDFDRVIDLNWNKFKDQKVQRDLTLETSNVYISGDSIIENGKRHEIIRLEELITSGLA